MRLLSADLRLAKDKIQYDVYVKRILSNRHILALLMKYTVDEFQSFSVRQIEQEHIGSNIRPASIPIEPGWTNIASEAALSSAPRQDSTPGLPGRIPGSAAEDAVPHEGTVYFDIRFPAFSDSGIQSPLLINVEAQRKFYNKGYRIVTRGIFYGARMISAQLDTEFTIPHYRNLKKVYSIWICMNAPKKIGNAISEYHIHKTDRLPGLPDQKQDYDKLSVIMICLNQETQPKNITADIQNNPNLQLIFFLNTLLSPTMSVQQKEQILHTHFQLSIDEPTKKELTHMCYLSDEIEERGIRRGRRQGRKQGRRQGEALLSKLNLLLISENRISDLERASKEPAYRHELYKFYHLK